MHHPNEAFVRGLAARSRATKGRADERTRTADLISLRVMFHALQGVARDCKWVLFRGFSLPWLALRCTVLRSRWCQSGVNIALVSTFE